MRVCPVVECGRCVKWALAARSRLRALTALPRKARRCGGSLATAVGGTPIQVGVRVPAIGAPKSGIPAGRTASPVWPINAAKGPALPHSCRWSPTDARRIRSSGASAFTVAWTRDDALHTPNVIPTRAAWPKEPLPLSCWPLLHLPKLRRITMSMVYNDSDGNYAQVLNGPLREDPSGNLVSATGPVVATKVGEATVAQ